MIRDSAQSTDISPLPHFAETLRAQHPRWRVLFAEAYDNMLDAACRRGEITLGPVTRLIDDGIGITRDRERAIVRLGEHGHMASTNLGVFGMGITWNLMASCDRVDVRSVSRDGQLDISVDWSEAMARNWNLTHPPRWSAVPRSRPTGTTITLSRLRWTLPAPRELVRMREKLAVLFQPALASGITLILDGVQLPVLDEPALRFPIRTTVEIRPEKGATVIAGMLVTPQGPLREVHLTKGHRVLEIGSFGCFAYPGIASMFARVTLIGSWTLTPFKDGLSTALAQDAADVAALENRVHEVLLPLLERCQAEAMTAQVEEMVRLVNDVTPEDLLCVRPPKKKPPSERPEPPTPRPRKQHNISREGEPSGPARRRQPQSEGLLIDLVDNIADEHGVGHVVFGRPDRVKLALDDPYIAAHVATRHKLEGARVLNQIALALYEYEREKRPMKNERRGDRQPRLPMPIDLPFGVRLARRLAQQRVNQDLVTGREAQSAS